MRFTQLTERGRPVPRTAFGKWSAETDWARADRLADESQGRQSPGTGSSSEGAR